MKVAVTGASGLIGSALVPSLRDGGHTVLRLVRREPSAPDEVRWDPAAGTVDLAPLQGTGAVVHLAGAGVGDHRWTESYKRTIRQSRVDGTGTVATAVARLDPPPRVLVSASAVGFYGDTGDRVVDESAPRGAGFLADVVRDWEAAADPAREAGVRVVHPRSGIVAARTGGAFGRLLPFFRLGVGGPLGSGRQWWSLISLEDEVRALRFLIDRDDVDGPVNLAAAPAQVRDIATALGRALHRPSLLPVPSPVLRVALGEMSSEVLGSVRVESARLRAAGFTFRHQDLDSIVGSLV